MKWNRRVEDPGSKSRRQTSWTMRGWFAHLVGIAAMIAVAGCGSGQFDFADVSGTVTLDGKPLPDVAVMFQPLAEGRGGQAGTGSVGVTDAQGRYTLKAADGSQQGAVVGRHRVMFTAGAPQRDATDDTAAAPVQQVIPPQYKQNPPEFEVPAGGTQQADFALTSN